MTHTPDVAGEGREYRKTATIRAVQWFKMGDHPAVVLKSDPRRYADEGIPWVETLEGGHVVSPGDWIATGVQGEHWPIKPDVFATTYAPVNEESSLTRPVSPLTVDLHPDTARLVNAFAISLAHKLLGAQQKYGYSNGWLTDDWEDRCQADLLAHVHKGDPLDVAAYAAFCWAREWPTTPPAIPDREEIVAGLKRVEFLLTDPARSYSENIARGRSSLRDLLAKLEGQS